MNRKERKFLQQHRELYFPVCSNGNLAVGTDRGYTDVMSGTPGAVGRWVALGFDSTDPTSNSMLYNLSTDSVNISDTVVGATTRGFNQSPFALVIPQGVGAQDRIGRDISVVSDDWYIRFTIPQFMDSWRTQRFKAGSAGLTGGSVQNNHVQRVQPAWTYDAGGAGQLTKMFQDGLAISQLGISQRPMRIRLVCIYQPVCDKPGLFGFRPNELFESQYDIHSRFSKDDACGYKILYDKTKSFVPQQITASLGTTPSTDLHNRQGRYKVDATFRMRTSFLRRYEGRTSPDNTAGSEVQVDSGTGVVDGGVSRGALSWYMFLEDAYADQHLNAANAVNVTTHSETPSFVCMEVNRKTLWTDP